MKEERENERIKQIRAMAEGLRGGHSFGEGALL